MTKEIISKNQELAQRLSGENLVVWGSNDLKNGKKTELMLSQVAAMIETYTQDSKSRGEMLSKKVEELMEVSQAGRAVLISRGDEAVGFAALWPLIDREGVRISEFGSWIVKEEWRHSRVNGVTIGELTAQELLGQENGAVIATIKRANSMKGLGRVGFSLVMFNEFPMVSALTCSCATSEHFTEMCSYRRTGLSEKESASRESDSEVLKIPCSLMVADKARLELAERRLRERFEAGGGTLKAGVIDRNNMAKMRAFYQEMGVQI